jgi:hypothetical protein
VVSDKPLDFEDRDEYFLATSHASKIFQWEDRWYITSCSRAVNDVTHTLSDRTKGLYLARIDWSGLHPKLAPLSRTLGVDDAVVEEGGMVYPNPVGQGGRVRFVLPEGRRGRLRVTDLLGREVLSATFSDTGGDVEIDTSTLPVGIYLVRIDGWNGIRKLVVR